MSTPFDAALGPALDNLPAPLAARFRQPPGTALFRGTMSRIWRARGLRGLLAAPLLGLGGLFELVFPETGENIPFELQHTVAAGRDGRREMTFVRSFEFPHRTRSFTAVMLWDPAKRIVEDRLGRPAILGSEIIARTENGAMVMATGRQWLQLGPLRIPLLRILGAQATAIERATPDGRFSIELTISNPLLGPLFGYSGTFAQVDPDELPARG